AQADRLEVVALAAGRWSTALAEQVRRWRPSLVAVPAPPSDSLDLLPTRLVTGEDSLVQLVREADADLVMMAVPGRLGLCPALAALEMGTTVALANKESLVMAGHLVMASARASGAVVLPVDSEHNAIWQCLRGEGTADTPAAEVQ